MGTIRNTVSHHTRSSGKLSAWGKSIPIVRMLVIIVLAVALFVSLAMVLWQGSSIKQVTLIVNGETEQFETNATDVAELLAQRDVEVQEYDKISLELDAKLRHGDTIAVQHALPVLVNVDGRTKTYYTTEATIGQLLNTLQVELREEDKVFPQLQTPIRANAEVKIVRVDKVIEEVTEVIPYETVTKQDANLLKGKSETVQEGKEGILLKRYEKVLEDGVVVAERLIDEEVATPSLEEVVAIGTKNPVVVLSASSPAVESVTKNGITFGAKQVLKNVKLTAYDAGPNSTGKTEDHPWYGMTYSGTKVQEGRTIAVDPKVIPLGWWVYIEGIGFRRAEDIGSAIKGKIIDIYFDSEEHAKKFGTKSGNTVYVIGPKKPEAQ